MVILIIVEHAHHAYRAPRRTKIIGVSQRLIALSKVWVNLGAVKFRMEPHSNEVREFFVELVSDCKVLSDKVISDSLVDVYWKRQ